MKPYIEVKSVKELCKALGLPISQAPKIEMRRDLVIAIRDVILKKTLTHAQAGEIAKVGRTIITAIVNGNISKISTDKLIDVATFLGVRLHLDVAA